MLLVELDDAKLFNRMSPNNTLLKRSNCDVRYQAQDTFQSHASQIKQGHCRFKWENVYPLSCRLAEFVQHGR